MGTEQHSVSVESSDWIKLEGEPFAAWKRTHVVFPWHHVMTHETPRDGRHVTVFCTVSSLCICGFWCLIIIILHRRSFIHTAVMKWTSDALPLTPPFLPWRIDTFKDILTVVVFFFVPFWWARKTIAKFGRWYVKTQYSIRIKLCRPSNGGWWGTCNNAEESRQWNTQVQFSEQKEGFQKKKLKARKEKNKAAEALRIHKKTIKRIEKNLLRESLTCQKKK